MISKENYTLDFLKNTSNHYLINNNSNLKNKKEFQLSDFCLYHIEELTFEEKAPRKEALENVLSSLRLDGVNLLYLISGDENGVHFYFGVVRDLTKEKELTLNIDDVGEYILKSSINGNFRGSKVEEVKPRERMDIKDKLSNMNNYAILEGVPGINEDSEGFQGVDRLVDVVLGDRFFIGILASPLNASEIIEIEKNLYNAYSEISPLSKKSVQEGTNLGSSNSITKNENTTHTESANRTKSNSNSESENKSKSDSSNKGESKSQNKSTSKSTTKSSGSSSSSTQNSGTEGSSYQKSSSTTIQNSTGTSTSKSFSISDSSSKSKSVATSTGTNDTTSKGTTYNETIEFSNKEATEWIKYLDEVILPRLDYGKGKGIFITTTFIATENTASLIKIGNTMKSLYCGKEGNKVPLRLQNINNKEYLNYIKDFQIPYWEYSKGEEATARSVVSHYMINNKLAFGNWISTNELSLIAGLPQKEVVGLSLKEEVEFGLNFKSNIPQENKISLGNLVQSGRELEDLNIDVYLDKENLNKHIFITGVTGSGKTTTCHKILMSANTPFMVIEPAKTEYRELTKYYDDVIIFTLGNDSVAPFRLNPFEFYSHENISSRVDMIKASLEAAFDMEAAIPQILETAIYECYEDFGWNMATSKNELFENPFAEGVYAFPTLSDLVAKVDRVVENQGFDDRLKNDYIGSIKARLQGLTVGSKGLMLNTKKSIDFEDLLDKKVILELEEIKNGNEKSLIMGFVLINLNEAIKSRYLKDPKFKHITLVEEAHRLLSRCDASDSQNKKQAVETFSDMLAEVRKYGESLIIVDQIPNKLTPDVLKNTNTKIVHKIFAKDDKEAIGNTMDLSEEQKGFLSSLDVGKAVVFSQGWSKSLQVKVKRITNTTSEEMVDESVIRNNILKFYQQNYKKGILIGLGCLDKEPSIEFIESYLEFLQDGKLKKEFATFVNNGMTEFDFNKYISKLNEELDLDILSNYLSRQFYIDSEDFSLEERREVIKETIKYIVNENKKGLKSVELKGKKSSVLKTDGRKL